MTDTKISDLPPAGSVAAPDLVPIVQGGITKKATISQVQIGGPLQDNLVATEDIPAYAPVTSQGKVANSANPSASLGKVVGIALTSMANGFSGPVAQAGEVTNPGWAWTTGDVLFLNGPSLAISAPATGFVQILGTAKAPTTIIVDLGQPFTF